MFITRLSSAVHKVKPVATQRSQGKVHVKEQSVTLMHANKHTKHVLATVTKKKKMVTVLLFISLCEGDCWVRLVSDTKD